MKNNTPFIQFGSEIPKIAHFYWGNSKLPFVRFLTLHTFAKLNPDWQLKYYVPKIKDSKITYHSVHQTRTLPSEDYSHLLSTLPNLIIEEINFEELGIPEMLTDVYKSDIIRWKILGEQGGIWSDMDIIFFKPMNNIPYKINKRTPYMICKYPAKDLAFPIGFLMASSDNVFYKTLYDIALKELQTQTENYQKFGTFLFTKHVKSFPECSEFFTELVYPVIPSRSQIDDMYKQPNFNFSPQCIGIHWFGGHPMGDVIESKVVPSNYNGFGAVTKAIGLFEKQSKTTLRELDNL